MADKPRKPKGPTAESAAAVAPVEAGSFRSIGEALREVLGSPAGLFGSLSGLNSGESVGEAMRRFMQATPTIDPAVFESIQRDAEENRQRLLDSVGSFQVADPLEPYVIEPMELGPTVEQELLTGVQQELAGLREITGGQATNIALQARIAEAQSAKLDGLIEAIKHAAAVTERLERTAITVAKIAPLISLIVAIPVVVDLVNAIPRVIGAIPTPAP